MKASFSFVQFFVLCAIGLAIAACSGGSSSIGGKDGSTGQFSSADGSQGVGGSAATDAQKIFAANAYASNGSAAEDYKIAPLDVVDISVFGVPDLNRTVQVSTTGMVSLPLVKTIKAGGRTQAQLEKDIAGKLEAGYLQSPQVSVFVKEYNSQRITVDGAVKKPGIFPTVGKVSLLQAIALAEGLNEVADPSGVLLFRTIGNKRVVARFDIKSIRNGKLDDPQLVAGDIVMVDESLGRTTLRDIKSVLPLSGLFQTLLL